MIKYITTILLKNTEYLNYPCNYYPTIYDIVDTPGSSVIICGPNTSDRLYITGAVRSCLVQAATEEKPVAPTTQFSESFLLKLVAVSRDANLIKDLNL